MLDGSGNHAGHFRYDPWGNLVSTPGILASDVKFRYGTNYQDSETGYYLVDHRYYDPVLRRWLSRDPLEEAGGLNLYGYCANDPINKIDPFGESEITIEMTRTTSYYTTDSLGRQHEVSLGGEFRMFVSKNDTGKIFKDVRGVTLELPRITYQRRPRPLSSG